MTAARERLAGDYPPVLMAYLAHPDEEHRHAAYQLGRAALVDGVSLLDLIRTHHATVGPILAATVQPDVPATFDAAATFLVEAMVPYDIARSGFLEQAGNTTSGRPAGGAGTACA